MAKIHKRKHELDKGYAWVILLGCTTMYMLLGGATKAYGVLYMEFLLQFNAGSGTTAWMPSIFYMISFGFGPFSNYFGQKVSFRVASFIGALVLSVGYIATGFVSRMEYMYITYGVVCGIGYGMSFSPFTTVLNYYFEKRRSFANGIMSASGGIGAFVFPLFYRYLIDEYGLRGALGITGAVLLHACPAALLLRQPVIFARQETQENVKMLKKTTDSHCSDGDTHRVADAEDCSLLMVTENIQSNITNETESIKINVTANEYVLDNNGMHIYVDGKIADTLDIKAESIVSSNSCCDASQNTNSISHETDMNERLEEYRGNFPSVATETLIRDMTSMTTISTSGNSQEKIRSHSKVCSAMPNFKFVLFTNPRFSLLAFSMWMFMVGFVNNLVTIPAHVFQVGLSSSEASMCISILGGCDVVARIFIGWLSDRKNMNVKWMFVLNMLIGGIFGLLLPYFRSFVFLATYSMVVGFFVGSFWCVLPAMLIDAVGLDNFAAGYGLIMLGFGCLAAVSLPIIGWLEDVTGSWDASFRLTGAILLLAAAIQTVESWLLRIFSSWGRKRTLKHTSKGTECSEQIIRLESK